MPETPLTPPNGDHMERLFWLKFRQGLLIQLAAVEERLGMPRTKEPRRTPEDGKEGR